MYFKNAYSCIYLFASIILVKEDNTALSINYLMYTYFNTNEKFQTKYVPLT